MNQRSQLSNVESCHLSMNQQSSESGQLSSATEVAASIDLYQKVWKSQVSF